MPLTPLNYQSVVYYGDFYSPPSPFPTDSSIFKGLSKDECHQLVGVDHMPEWISMFKGECVPDDCIREIIHEGRRALLVDFYGNDVNMSSLTFYVSFVNGPEHAPGVCFISESVGESVGNDEGESNDECEGENKEHRRCYIEIDYWPPVSN